MTPNVRLEGPGNANKRRGRDNFPEAPAARLLKTLMDRSNA